MKQIPYTSAVNSLMYAQVCYRPNIAYAVSIFVRFQSNPLMDHQRAVKEVMRYVQCTKDFMLVCSNFDDLEIVGYSNINFLGSPDDMKSTSGYILKWVVE